MINQPAQVWGSPYVLQNTSPPLMIVLIRVIVIVGHFPTCLPCMYSSLITELLEISSTLQLSYSSQNAQLLVAVIVTVMSASVTHVGKDD